MNRGNFLDLSDVYLAVLSQIFSSFHFQTSTAYSFMHSCLWWCKLLQVYSPNFTSRLTLPSKAHILGYGNQMTRTDMLCQGDTGQFITLEI